MAADWVHGSFAAVAEGDGDGASPVDLRRHRVQLLDCTLIDAVAAAPAPAPAEALQLGDLPDVALQPRGSEGYIRVSLHDAVLLAPSYANVRDDGARSLTLLSGPLRARLPRTSDATLPQANAAPPPMVPSPSPAVLAPPTAGAGRHGCARTLGCGLLAPLG